MRIEALSLSTCRQRVSGFAIASAMVFLAVSAVAAVDQRTDMNKLSDRTIEDAIDKELMMDPGVTPYGIEADSEDGILTLSGTVDNLLAKERAAKIAKTVKGVRAVINTIVVSAVSLTPDDQLKERVVAALTSDPVSKDFDLKVQVDAAKVTLSGPVTSWQEREIAGRAAKSVRGVLDVSNEIMIDHTAALSDIPRHDDARMVELIRRLMRWDVFIDHALIDVRVENGHVTLAGQVGSAAEKSYAETKAWYAGAKTVDSTNLTVKVWARDYRFRENKYVAVGDAEIRNAIQTALAMDWRVRSFNVDVDVDDGVVTLRGAVSNVKAKDAAERNARNTVGVRRIKNSIQVEPMITDDRLVGARVRDAIARDPYLEGEDIFVTVRWGVASLSGNVDTEFQRLHARAIASGVDGVKRVVNNVTVAPAARPYVPDPYVELWSPFEGTLPELGDSYSYKSDRDIEEDIRDEIWWSPFVDLEQVGVSVVNGTAILTGTVDTWNERMAASENAFEGGATRVRNNLNVR